MAALENWRSFWKKLMKVWRKRSECLFLKKGIIFEKGGQKRDRGEESSEFCREELGYA
jgi:hypothetical protein